MRTSLVVLALLLLAACGSRTGGAADDPADGGSGAAPPTGIPAAAGEVRTRGVVTVLDDGSGAQLCLGPVAESWPPQCGGPPLVGWDWRGQPPPTYEQAAGVRWGQYALTGRWDGESFTLTTVVPAAQHRPPAEERRPLPEPEEILDEAELQSLSEDLFRQLPGALTSYADGSRVHVEVVYDDGSLQEWADRRHGAGLVVVTPALVDVPGA